ncbi:TPA: transposase domain-containing protein [Streptococcus pyogenes]|nr:transposase domain-containing protein [Streptococcus pyogenes]HER2937914.1 transposase domain-containing protein [Streptococcus pyogenes]
MVCGKTDMRHGLNSEKYISYLLDRLPNGETLAKREVLEAYLPWAKEVQTNCQ